MSQASVGTNENVVEENRPSSRTFQKEDDGLYEEASSELEIKVRSVQGNGDEEPEPDEEILTIDCQTLPHKSHFRFKRNDNGNILTIHHTIRDGNKLVRIRLGVCCFNERGASTKFVAIDKRGNIFVFDLTGKRFWKLSIVVLKPSAIVASKYRENEYIVGTKAGQLLLIDIERSVVLRCAQISHNAIGEITFQESQQQAKRSILVHTGSEAIIVNLNSFTATHRLDFDEGRMSLKYVCYLPQSERIFTCFTNDSIHIWSGTSLKTLQVTHPIRSRKRKLRGLRDECVPSFKLRGSGEYDAFVMEPCIAQNFGEGLINSYNFTTHNGGLLCLTTVDKYLLLISPHTFDVLHVYHLDDFIIKKCAILTVLEHVLILALTTIGEVVLLDCECPEFKVKLHSCAIDITVASDNKLLAVIADSGEAELWTVNCLYSTLMSQRECMTLLKEAFKQPKPLAIAPSNECFNEDIKKLLKRDRLISILKEYGYYPSKYRGIIWCALLKLPYNRREFQQLLKGEASDALRQRAHKMQLKNENIKRALIKNWKCLSNWAKVFAYSEFFPHLIYPFVKLFPKNALVLFEVCVTLLHNHFQMWFEYHPSPPADYLGMCQNVLQHFDDELFKFYVSHDITSRDYAWQMLSNAFSEVLDEEQWLILWDNIISCPIYFPIFCVVAYNILQREVILLLPDKPTIQSFFREQNPLNINKLVSKALSLMNTCPETRHPERYFNDFQPIPKKVYPKFLRYPREWVCKHEDELKALQQEQEAIDARIRELELNEFRIMEELEEGLKEEENAKRLKEMENLYFDAIRREEERIICQRKLLLLYQKEMRGYKGQVLTTLRETERRKQALELEKQLDILMHNIESERRRYDSALILAEDEIKNQNFELLTKQQMKQNYPPRNLASIFRDDIKRLMRERELLGLTLSDFTSQTADDDMPLSCRRSNLEEIERKLDDIQREFQSLKENSKKS